MTMYLAKATARIAAVLVLTCGSALAQMRSDLFESDSKAPTIKLTAVVLEMPTGTPYLTLRSSNCLFTDRVVSAVGGRERQELPFYTAAFKREMDKAGFNVVADDNLFNEDRAPATYQVGAVIVEAQIRACMGDGGIFGAVGEANNGTGTMKVDWQVYSSVEKKVVAHINTTGTITKADKGADSLIKIFAAIFANSARDLAANAEFRTAVSRKPPTAQEILTKEPQSKIVLQGNSKAAKQSIADATGSVVTLLTSNASGSGVLLSDDGYILTNAHVVGDETELRVRWSDGIEKVGQVIRSSKPRDVALVKTDPRERSPLPILRGPVSPGQKVFAIGSPLGKALQSTVSSGVVSAMRTDQGLRFIQSDVAISPGSSGGALLNESGSVIGITVSSAADQRAQSLNFFIPIGDAMDFLNLEQD